MSAVAGTQPVELIGDRRGLRSIHIGTKTMRQMRMLGWVGPLLLVMAAPMTTAAAQDQGSCAQIRAACLGAGFVQGAAREGIGPQVHCMAPIMQRAPAADRAQAIAESDRQNWWRTAGRAARDLHGWARRSRKHPRSRGRQLLQHRLPSIRTAIRRLLSVAADRRFRLHDKTRCFARRCP